MQKKTSNALLRAGLAASTIGALMTATFLFAGIASADVTGYQTGYQYVQGLAIGDGAALEAAAMNGSTGAVAQSTAAPAATTGTGVTTSATAPATTPATAPAVAPAVNTAPAAAPATSNAVAPATAGLSQPLTIALWIVIALAAIALIGAVIAGVANANRESAARNRRSASYQG